MEAAASFNQGLSHPLAPIHTFPASVSPNPGQSGAGVWALLLPPPPTPHPRLPLYPPYPPRSPFPHPYVPWARPTPWSPHVTYITAEPLPSYSAQTHNVLTVDHRHITTAITSRPAGNSPGSFPVNVIPYDNSSLHVVDTQIQNPLMVEDRDGGGGRRHNASRAADVLGQRFPTDSHAST
ncbi:hypothetical protein SK128_019586 [Halocaridina rubra]|uniref:Uncharacterized protein n=1 Tax=Halocaridina rubra TaxID=373956 RepID=A0AAN9A377_HALRR